LKNWDLVTFDFWIKDKEIWVNTDAAFSIIIWWDDKNPKWARLIETNKKALYAGIEKCKVWNTFWDIGKAIQSVIENDWFKVVKNLTWHSIWKELHEKPYVYNYGNPWSWPAVKKWMVLCIEPILWETSWEIIDNWDWEVYIKDGSLWSQYEHTILVTDGEPEIII
jgi:methionyl aminopeptidase